MSASETGGTHRLLLLPSYTRPSGDSEASDEIGYGISVGAALEHGLIAAGHAVQTIDIDPSAYEHRIDYVHACYAELARMPLTAVDAILLFHAFHQFPAEIRRILAVRGYHRLPLIGFTHGSHLDPTDEFRERIYPGMLMADLGNLMCLDRVLVVSETFRATLERQVAALAPAIAGDFARRLTVCGMAFDPGLIDRCAAPRPMRLDRTAIVFNHSPSPAKAPGVAFEIVGRVMMAHDSVDLVVTRAFSSGDMGYETLMTLRDRFGDRVRLCGTLSLPEYYRTLWQSDVQISTALHESFGVSTLEAMYTGNCCLVPDRQAYPELTQGVGLYGNTSELEALLASVVRDRAKRREIADAQHERSLLFRPERMAARIGRALDEAIDGGRTISRSSTQAVLAE